jgi:hypothetical protein
MIITTSAYLSISGMNCTDVYHDDIGPNARAGTF